MQPHDFLAAVLPSTGFYCVAELTSNKKEHRYVDTFEAVAFQAEKFSAAKKDAYFGLASFKEAGSRLTDNAHTVRALFADVDCGPGKAYESKTTATAALESFLQTSGLASLGQPWVVDSGGGIHIYWPFEKDVEIAEWRPVAEAFKRKCRELEFNIDMTVSADASRVLRMPGTTNFKYPAPVKLLLHGDIFEFEILRITLGSKPAAAPIRLPFGDGPPPKPTPTASTLKLMENSTTMFKNIMVRTLAGNGCKQLAYYVDHASEDGMEPLWRAMLSIAKPCEDGATAAKKLSAMHPYPEDRMLVKLREIKGPYPCTKIDSENPSVCPDCAHWGKITNPLALGRETMLDAPKEKILEAKATEEAAPQPVVRPAPPRGFSFGSSGGVFREKPGVDDDAPTQVMVLPYDMFIVELMHVDGVHSAHFVAVRGGISSDVMLALKCVVSKDETVKALAQQNIIAAFGSGNDKNLFDFIRACVEDASNRKPPAVIPVQYGWQVDKTFVYNGRIYTNDGAVRSVPMPGLENLTYSTTAKGTIENWRAIINMFVRRELHEIIAHGCIGFGSPLMEFTGMRGLTFHAGHRHSGTGKSLALSMAASIWGHPINYRTGKSTSPVAMQQRAGILNSLPFVCDELTVKARSDAEWFPSFVFDFSEGRGKERMEAGANKERINTSTWSSLSFFTSNTRMLDFMTGVRQFSSEGELRRFLEWSPALQIGFTESDLALVRGLNANYGVAGEMYVRWLVTHRDTAERVVQEVRERLAREYATTNDERFWLAGVSAVVAGAILAGNKHAGIIDLPVKGVIECFRKIIDEARAAIKNNAVSAEDILNDYIRDYYGQFVVLRKSDGGLLAQLGNGEMIDQSITRTKIAGRVEHNVDPDWTDFYIEETVLKRHCSLYGFGFADFKRDLEKAFKIHYMRKDMLNGTKGPTMRVAAVKISRRTGEMLDDTSTSTDHA